jgi:hypothetical protein
MIGLNPRFFNIGKYLFLPVTRSKTSVEIYTLHAGVWPVSAIRLGKNGSEQTEEC